LGYEVARRGGTAGAVLNAANEVAVGRFLAGEIRFPQIVQACRSVLEHHTFDPSPSLDGLLASDRWAREQAGLWG
jgi:1-deoxy-D-xylulose-5-phosphate reductoisomerase